MCGLTSANTMTQPGNAVNATSSHLITGKAGVFPGKAGSFRGPIRKRRTDTLEDTDPEIRNNQGVVTRSPALNLGILNFLLLLLSPHRISRLPPRWCSGPTIV